MKNLTTVLLIITISVLSCKSNEVKDNNTTKSNETQTVSKISDTKKVVAKEDSKKIVTTLDSETFKTKVFNFDKNQTWIFEGKKPCIVDFYADWCGPCKIASPLLEEVAKEFEGQIDVYKINTDNNPRVSQIFGIKGIPAFLYCPMQGKPQMTSGIARSKEETKEMFRKQIKEILLNK